jgi:uncharacterized protein
MRPLPATPPWYRQLWPWLLIAPPAASVVMGAVMWTLAVRSDDGLVVDDYYKQGLAINQVLDREARARALALRAELAFDVDRRRVRLALEGEAPPPGQVILRLVHPTRTGEDQVIVLGASGAGPLEGSLRLPASGRWRVILEDRAGSWRLRGWWHTRDASARLSG